MPRLLEKVRSGFNWLRETLFKRLLRARFRYDVFISYSHSEKPYAVKLKEQLTRLDFSCFIDEEESPPGSSLDPTLTKALRKSAVLVLLATERALDRPYIISEFEKFAVTKRTIVPINILGALTKNNEEALSKLPWKVINDRKIVWIDETDEAFSQKNPSPKIADGIDKLFKYTRRNVRVRTEIIGTAVLVLIAALGAGYVIKDKTEKVNQEIDRAEKAGQRADAQERRAIDAGNEAEKQTLNAERAKRDAEQQQQIAEEARINAERQQQLAETATADAKKQQKVAADAKAEADRQLRIAKARQLANEAELARGTNSDDLIKSTSIAIRSLQLHPTLVGDMVIRKDLSLLSSLTNETPYQSRPKAAAMSPNATAVGFLNANSEVEIRRAGKEIVRKRVPKNHSLIALSDDGAYFVTAGGDTALIQETDKEQPTAQIGPLEDTHFRAIALSPGGKYLAMITRDGNEGLQVDVREREGLKWLGVVDRGSLHFDELTTVAFSSNNEKLLAVGGFDQEGGGKNAILRTWLIREDTSKKSDADKDCKDTFILKSSFRQALSPTMIAISSDDNYLIIANQDTALVWQKTRREDYEEIARIPLEKPLAVGFGKSARHVHVVSQPAGSSGDATMSTATLRIWESSGRVEETGIELNQDRKVFDASRFDKFDYSDDGNHLAGADEQGTVQVSDLKQGSVSENIVTSSRLKSLKSIELSWDGKFLALVGTVGRNEPKVYVYQRLNGSYQEVPGNLTIPVETNLEAVALSPNGLLLATATPHNDQLKLWNVKIGNAETRRPMLLPAGSRVESIIFSPKGERIAALCSTGEARVWEVSTGAEVASLSGVSGGFNVDVRRNIAFSHDGRYIALGNYDHTARVFEVSTGEELMRLLHDHPVTSVSFSHDGKYLATSTEAAEQDTTVQPFGSWKWLLQPQDLIAEACRRSPRACGTNPR